MVVGVEVLDIKNDIQDGKDYGTQGQEIFIVLGKPTVLIIILRSAAGSGWCLAICYFIL